MRIPKQFQLAGAMWTVTQVPHLTELGLCKRDTNEILLQKGQKQSSKEIAFCHELVHAIRFTMGDGGPHDEKEIDSFAYLLHQFMITKV